jgi:hypothetical protein
MKNKKFDCVKLQHDGAEKVYELTHNMTIAEEIAYWQRRSEELRRLRLIRKTGCKCPESVSPEISFRQAEAA